MSFAGDVAAQAFASTCAGCLCTPPNHLDECESTAVSYLRQFQQSLICLNQSSVSQHSLKRTGFLPHRSFLVAWFPFTLFRQANDCPDETATTFDEIAVSLPFVGLRCNLVDVSSREAIPRLSFPPSSQAKADPT